MADLLAGEERREALGAASAVASRIPDHADRDVAFVVRLVGESQYALVQHFVSFIAGELGKRGIVYGAHPLLRPFIETHARELTDFVPNGVRGPAMVVRTEANA
jgi:hypothetical protein